MSSTEGIIRVSEMLSLALHGMAFLASGGNRVMSAGELARAIGASEAHLAKTMQKLTKAGLTTSGRGPKGGFALAKPPDTITLFEVYQAIEGTSPVENCPLGRKSCSFRSCLFGGILGELGHQLSEYLSGRRLADFIAETGVSDQKTVKEGH